MVARELTKRYESLYVGDAASVRRALGEEPRGEIVVIVEASERKNSGLDAALVLDALLEELPPTKAAKVAARILGERRGDMYDLARTRK